MHWGLKKKVNSGFDCLYEILIHAQGNSQYFFISFYLRLIPFYELNSEL